MGLKREKIAVIGENRYEWCLTYLATTCGTGTIVPLDKELPANELKYLLERAKVKAIVKIMIVIAIYIIIILNPLVQDKFIGIKDFPFLFIDVLRLPHLCICKFGFVGLCKLGVVEPHPTVLQMEVCIKSQPFYVK